MSLPPAPSTDSSLVVAAVDDSPMELNILDLTLRRSKSFQGSLVTHCEPDQALAELPGLKPDVLLIDYSLGSITGLALLEELRSAGVEAPAILMTGWGNEAVIMEALHQGFTDYLPKSQLSEKSLLASIEGAYEKDLRQRQSAQHQQELEQIVQRLEAQRDEISGFYHTLAHELKTPLTGIREFVSIVSEGLCGAINVEQKELLSSAIANCDQLRRCVDDLIDVSRLETGKFSIDLRANDLAETVRSSALLVQKRAEDRNVRLIVDIADFLPKVTHDDIRIGQVLGNLLANALKFTPAGGLITLTVRKQQDGYVRICVRDTGVGIPEGDLDRVFERLFQKDGHAAVHGGMGLGLHLARELTRLHGGELTAESREGVGSAFTLRLPSTGRGMIRPRTQC